MVPIALIVAVAQKGIIGKNNQLPWHLPKDLAYFKKITMDCPVIMGRKTYDSIGKALPNRSNIVITRNQNYRLSDADVVNSLDEAIFLAKKHQPREIYIIGGASIFLKSLNLIDKIYLNKILADLNGDTFLPEIDWLKWHLVSCEHQMADEKNAYAINFEVYEKNERT